ncbi:ribonuclease R, partial [Pseudomonas aeruginosa]|nr:ribonuclease R [Pseudomonas aeruginosa]
KAGKVQAPPPVAPELLAQAAEMLGNTDVRKSREVKQALLAEARVGGGKDKGGKKGKVVPAGKSAKGKAKGGKPAAAAKPGKPTKHRKGPSKPKADNAPAATGARKRKAKS